MPLDAAGVACEVTGSSRATMIATWMQARRALLTCYLLGGPMGQVLLLGVIGGTH